MTDATHELLPVTQADRDAAAALVAWHNKAASEWRTDGGNDLTFFAADMPDAIRKGVWDSHDVVQAFARHRLSHRAALTPALSGDAGEGESEGWRPIETCPQEDLFIGAVQVRDNRSGAEWWERHLLALDGETGEIHADYEQGWALADYSWWLPFSTPPIPAALPSHQGAE